MLVIGSLDPPKDEAPRYQSDRREAWQNHAAQQSRGSAPLLGRHARTREIARCIAGVRKVSGRGVIVVMVVSPAAR